MTDTLQYAPPALVPVPTTKGNTPNTALYDDTGPVSDMNVAANPESKSKWSKWAEDLGKVGNILTPKDGAPAERAGGAALVAGATPGGPDQLSPVVAKYLDMAQSKNPVAAWLQF